MVTFVLIDRYEYFGFSLSRIRVSWFFDNQFKTSISKINYISNVLSFKVNKVEYNLAGNLVTTELKT